MKMRYLSLLIILIAVFTSCYEDKGNYSYSEVEKITITLPQNIRALGYAEDISFSPTIVSSIKGELSENDPNYEFECKIRYDYKNEETGVTEKWMDINPNKNKSINYKANFPASTYSLWYSVRNKETNVTVSVTGTVTVWSSTYEGWMVLTEVGDDNHVDLDMISEDSHGQSLISHGLWTNNVLKLFGASELVMLGNLRSPEDQIYALTRSGSYRLDLKTLQYTESNNMKYWDFIVPSTPGAPLSMMGVGGDTWGPASFMSVTDIGNVYAITTNSFGAIFEDPLNTDAPRGEPTYRVSHMVGTGVYRPVNSTSTLLYDIDNKRFMGWVYAKASSSKILAEIPDPDGSEKKFSYKTGMNLIAMKNTRRSNGLVYSVLQDSQNKRHVYGINLSGSKFVQESVYSGINTEHFNDATGYAFHSKFALMFYCFGNKVYSCTLTNNTFLNEVVTLAENETVTMIKFNLYANPDFSLFNNPSEEFLDRQYDLIIGSTTGAEDGGIIRMYEVSSDGKMILKNEYKGLGKKIVDVTYRERRKQ